VCIYLHNRRPHAFLVQDFSGFRYSPRVVFIYSIVKSGTNYVRTGGDQAKKYIHEQRVSFDARSILLQTPPAKIGGFEALVKLIMKGATNVQARIVLYGASVVARIQ
jgi:hypothetical protein